MRGLPNVTYCTLIVKVQGIGEDMPSNMLSFINFELLEFYWTYFLALQITTLKIPSVKLMSLDHEPKNEMMCYEREPWALTPFLCKYELFWALEEIFSKYMIVLTWCGSPMKWSHVVCKICPQQLLLINMNYVEFFLFLEIL